MSGEYFLGKQSMNLSQNVDTSDTSELRLRHQDLCSERDISLTHTFLKKVCVSGIFKNQLGVTNLLGMYKT